MKSRWLVVAGLSILLLGACKSEPAVAPGGKVTDHAGARDAALEYLQEHEPENAPGTGLQWQEEDVTPEGLVGQAAREFASDGLTVRVPSPVVAPDYIVYHVTITSAQGGWRWQGQVKPDGTVTEVSPLTEMSEEASRKTAEDFVKNSPTFSFDGMENTLTLVNTLAARCPYCWVFVFEFDSRHAGYGHREGMMLAQVTTPHQAVISVEQGDITSAIMDEKWDMMLQQEVD